MSDPQPLDEITRIEQWIRTVLVSDPTLNSMVNGRVYAALAPASVDSYPMIVFSLLAPGDVLLGGGGVTIWNKPVYLIKAITKGDRVLPLQSVVDRMHAVLHAARGGVTGVAIDKCIRLRSFRMTTREAGNTYHHLGGEYEIAARSVA